MEWRDIAAKVAQLGTPIIAGVLGGPVGAAASVAGSLVAEALGVKPTPGAVDLALSAHPEAVVKLRELESNERTRFEALMVEAMRIEAQDRDSARRAAVDGGYAWGVFAFAVLIFVGVSIIEGLVLLGYADTFKTKLPDVTVGRILGTLDSALMLSLAYVFGGSADMLRQARRNQGGPK